MRINGSCLFPVLAGLLASCSPDEIDTREVAAVQRYTLSLERVKSGSNRRVLSLRVRTTAHLRSRSTRITIAIPELQSNAALKEGRVELAGERLVSLDSGQTAEIDFEVGLPQ